LVFLADILEGLGWRESQAAQYGIDRVIASASEAIQSGKNTPLLFVAA
jgi:hypothetical protein